MFMFRFNIDRFLRPEVLAKITGHHSHLIGLVALHRCVPSSRNLMLRIQKVVKKLLVKMEAAIFALAAHAPGG